MTCLPFQFTPEQVEFQREVAAYFRDEARPEWYSLDPESEAYRALGREMDRKLIEKGWYNLHWPKEYGGDGDPFRYGILREMSGYFRVPTQGGHGRYIVGPAIMAVGTEEQKKRYLPKLAKGELVMSLGFTEPNAGSDLAALQTKAELDGDHYVVNGSKLYITYGTYANAMFLAARTDLSAPRYKNMSLFLLDMTLPGITSSPLECLNGHVVTEVHFDNVRIPKDCLIGELNRGFYHMALALNYERAGVDRPALYMAHLEDLAEYCRQNGLWERPRVRQLIGALAAQLQAWRMVGWRVVYLQSQGRMPTWEASMSQFYRKEVNPPFGRAILEILGPRALIERGDPESVLYGRSEWYLREGFDNHGQGGRFVTRNVIARRGLDLPK
ncbi:acyl-CoA dehydrogenase family protein [Pigmentiphaga soli]|uniref:Acyl-CoA dehydrogenase family protein n=2 Tax=Pigmentiphaga soli TaxID=1007095 RepID=A0ABP8GM87_9BURK